MQPNPTQSNPVLWAPLQLSKLVSIGPLLWAPMQISKLVIIVAHPSLGTYVNFKVGHHCHTSFSGHTQPKPIPRNPTNLRYTVVDALCSKTIHLSIYNLYKQINMYIYISIYREREIHTYVYFNTKLMESRPSSTNCNKFKGPRRCQIEPPGAQKRS